MPIRIHTELTMISTDGISWMRQATFGGINIYMCWFTFMAAHTTHNFTFSISVIEAINHYSESLCYRGSLRLPLIS